MTIDCPECNRKFTFKSNLTRHLKMVHHIEVERQDIMPYDFDAFNYKCLEGCRVSFKYNRELRNHLKTEHNMDLIELNFEFPNSEAFNKWLYEEETNSYSQYVHLTATKKRSTGVETFYYECSRSGKLQCVNDNIRKRKPRKCGSLKLNRGCTSQIIVNRAGDDTHYVNYYKTHYGHETEVTQLKLSKQDRGTIASKLMLGMPVSSVLDSAQNRAESDNLKRINLLRRKDVLNIKKSLNINPKDGKVNVDTINISFFINECSQESYNPILYHNLEELSETDHVCLIIMNKYQADMLSEHCNVIVLNTTKLDSCDFILSTLFVFNENGEIFPTACMINDRKNIEVYQQFFQKIQDKIGTIASTVFISDVGEMYIKAWEHVMGQVVHNYFDSTQIEIDWKFNLNRIFCEEAEVTKVKRQWVYDTLKILQQLTDTSEFLENLDETIKLFGNDDDFKEFLKYFLEQYQNPKQWADCYRTEYDLSNLQIDTMSDMLRFYLNGENRFDKVFLSIIRLIRDETVNFMVKTDESTTVFLNDINLKHYNSTFRNFNVDNVTENVWTVLNESSSSYVVQRYLQKKCCNLICSTCRICIHCFSCSCASYFVSNSICEHVHYIWMTYFQSIRNDDSSDDELIDTNREEIIIEVNEDVEENVMTITEFLQNQISVKTTFLNTRVNGIACERKLKMILEGINNLCDLIEEADKEHLTTNEEKLKDTVLSDHSYL